MFTLSFEWKQRHLNGDGFTASVYRGFQVKPLHVYICQIDTSTNLLTIRPSGVVSKNDIGANIMRRNSAE